MTDSLAESSIRRAQNSAATRAEKSRNANETESWRIGTDDLDQFNAGSDVVSRSRRATLVEAQQPRVVQSLIRRRIGTLTTDSLAES